MSLERESLADVQQSHSGTILQLVKDCAPISRAAVATELHLGQAVVSAFLDELIRDGLVYESERTESSSKGQNESVPLLYHSSSRYALGVDIGGTKALFIITDLSGRVIAEKKIAVRKDDNQTLLQIAREGKRFLEETQLPLHQIVGTGVGIAGVFDPETGILTDAPALNIQNCNLYQIFKDYLPSPISLDNDVNVAVVGERWRGAAQNKSHAVMITMGTGIGAGIVVSNQLYKGAHGYAGEIGYFQFADSTPDNEASFQNYGYLDMLASGTGIAAHAKQWLAHYPSSILHKSPVRSEDVFTAAEAGDELAVRVIDTFLAYLSITISNIIVLLNPSVIVLGGGVAKRIGNYLDGLRASVEEKIPVHCPIVLSLLGETAGAMGAAATALIKAQCLTLFN